MQGLVEGVEDQAQLLERDDSQQRLDVARVAQNDRGMVLALRERDYALRYGQAHFGPVRKVEFFLPLRLEAYGLPDRLGQERVHRPAVDQEANPLLCSPWASNGAIYVADAHAPSLE